MGVQMVGRMAGIHYNLHSILLGSQLRSGYAGEKENYLLSKHLGTCCRSFMRTYSDGNYLINMNFMGSQPFFRKAAFWCEKKNVQCDKNGII